MRTSAIEAGKTIESEDYPVAEGEEQRYEFNFSKMQIVMIAGGVFILAAVMFALGMVVGKSLTEINTIVAQPAPKEAPALPSPAIPPAPAPTEHQTPAPSAPETARQETPAPTVSAPAEKPVEKQAPAQEAAKTEAPTQPRPQAQQERPVIQPLPSPPVELPEPTIMQTQTPQSMPAPQPSAKEAGTKPESAASASTKPESEPKKAVAKTRKPRTTAARQSVSSQKYMLQAASFSERADAENLVQTLKKRGFKATIAPIDIEGKGTWYRVRTGPYRNHDEADKNIQKLQKLNGLGLTPMLITAD